VAQAVDFVRIVLVGQQEKEGNVSRIDFEEERLSCVARAE